jgi:NADH:ubiquinone oxidoreductase subunit 4 (subunit M)
MVILRVVYLLLFNGVGSFIFYLFLLIMFYTLGVRGVNIRILLRIELLRISLILLSILIFIMMVFLRRGYKYSINSVREYNLIVFFLLMGLVFSFQLEDFFLFYVSFEFSVIPIFFLITGWGYRIMRIQAGYYMFLYTLISSLPFLLFLIVLVKRSFSLNYLIGNFCEVGGIVG